MRCIVFSHQDYYVTLHCSVSLEKPQVPVNILDIQKNPENRKQLQKHAENNDHWTLITIDLPFKPKKSKLPTTEITIKNWIAGSENNFRAQQKKY